ncbi:MAG: preprotein translocase subunit SecE [Actinobacteria bacterium]|nr:preprotein translocase subunit SecE [Actinomycetota bacterium]MBV8960601.1 preprotein translocase subunit SecE [Actinomycetota bacterium]MBV9254885.1 preprotein translocase subunit SecE [Actinomycetota bacterium]MBV9664587.1 preprotein translocase subunit SecE [Actinomycetota bacterium]
MNRQMKRMMQRQGQVGEDGAPAVQKRPQQQRPAPKPASQRTKPRDFLREVRAELRKVAWPTRAETVSYSVVVLVTLILFMGMILLLDLGFAKAILIIFKQQ